MLELTELTQALLDGDIEKSRALIARGETVEGHYFENNRGVVFANIVRARAIDIVDALVARGSIDADVYELERFDRTFFEALANGTTEEEASLAFLTAFLEKTDNLTDEVDGVTLLGFFLDRGAARGAIECLLGAGFDAAFKDRAERTYLHAVVEKRMQAPEIKLGHLRLLIDQGVEVDAKDITGTTPLLSAVKTGEPVELVDLLVQHGANPNEQDNGGLSPFFAAVCWQRNQALYETLKQSASPDFEVQTREGQHLLGSFLQSTHAPSEQEIALLNELLRDGADIYQTSPYYGQPKSGADWVAEKPAALLQAVLDTGVLELDHQDDSGETLLHKVCGFNVNYEQDQARELYRKVKLLLAAGADPALTNDSDKTPLELAQADNLKIKTVELLMRAASQES